MGWANDSINRGLAFAELPSSPVNRRYGIQDVDGRRYVFDETPTEKLLDLRERFQAGKIPCNNGRRQEILTALSEELATRALTQI